MIEFMEINQNQQEQLSLFAQKNGIKFVVLFGSQAKENAREDSDFDIAVLTTPEKDIKANMDNYNNILFGLSEILKIPDYKTDLTNLNRANILLGHEVVFGGKLIYGNENEYEEFKAFVFREYIDAKPLFDLEDFLVRKKLNLLKQAIG